MSFNSYPIGRQPALAEAKPTKHITRSTTFPMNDKPPSRSIFHQTRPRKLPQRPQSLSYKPSHFEWPPLRETAVREEDDWDEEDFSSTGIEALFSNNKISQPWYNPKDLDQQSSSSSDFWFETNSDLDSVRERDYELYDILTDDSDEDHFYLESRNFFNKSQETFLNNSLTNIKNNNSPFENLNNCFYDGSKKMDHYNLYKDYSYSNINTNNLVTKLPISSSKRPLGFGNTKTDIKQLNNRNYFFNNANRMFNEHLYLNNYNKKSLFHNLLFVKNKNTNKHNPITSLTRPLCFTASR